MTCRSDLRDICLWGQVRSKEGTEGRINICIQKLWDEDQPVPPVLPAAKSKPFQEVVSTTNVTTGPAAKAGDHMLHP